MNFKYLVRYYVNYIKIDEKDELYLKKKLVILIYF